MQFDHSGIDQIIQQDPERTFLSFDSQPLPKVTGEGIEVGFQTIGGKDGDATRSQSGFQFMNDLIGSLLGPIR